MPVFDRKSVNGILKDIKKILRTGILEGGPYVKKFEEMFSEYTDTTEAVAVSCGTAALEIALRFFNVKDKEVIVPTNTFIASPNAVIFAGGKPILADIRRETLCIDPDDISRKITPRTCGIIVVHIAGLVCPEIYQIKKICEDHNLFLIEDASHAHGATIDGKKAGGIGDVGCFSLYPTKVMTTCEGGIIVTNNSDLARDAKRMRNHGRDEKTGLSVMLGYNWLMDEIRAAIGVHQLEQLDQFIEKRNEIAREYNAGLRRIKRVKSFFTPTNIRHSYYKYPVLLDERIDTTRLVELLRSKYRINVGNIYYPPCHLQPIYKKIFGYKGGELPISEKVLKKVITLPMHYKITKSEINRVLNGLKKAVPYALS